MNNVDLFIGNEGAQVLTEDICLPYIKEEIVDGDYEVINEYDSLFEADDKSLVKIKEELTENREAEHSEILDCLLEAKSKSKKQAKSKSKKQAKSKSQKQAKSKSKKQAKSKKANASPKNIVTETSESSKSVSSTAYREHAANNTVAKDTFRGGKKKKICMERYIAVNTSLEVLKTNVHESQDHLKDFRYVVDHFVKNSRSQRVFRRNVELNVVNESKDHLKESLKSYVEDPILKNKLEKVLNVSNPNVATWYERSAAAWADFRWVCVYCCLDFNTQTELTAHSIQDHNCCNPYTCRECPRKNYFTEVLEFVRHSVTRHKDILSFTCYNCNGMFSSKHEYLDHKCPHYRYEHICKGCGSQFENVDKLNEHTSAYFSRRDFKDSYDLSCKTCNKTYRSKKGLVAHMAVHSNRKGDHVCKVCSKCFYSNSALSVHMKAHFERRFSCEVCHKSFKTSGRLELHVRRYSEKRYASSKSNWGLFQMALSSKKEVRSKRLPVFKPSHYICNYCEKQFELRRVLVRHIKESCKKKS